MNKVNLFKTISAIYLLVGCVTLLLVDHNVGFGIMAVVCFMGAAGYDDLANDIKKETILSNQLWEGTGHD